MARAGGAVWAASSLRTGWGRCAPGVPDALKGPTEKKSGEFFPVFQERFLAILTDAAEEPASLRGFVLPEVDLRNRTLVSACDFSGATFLENAYFDDATFAQEALFVDVTFIGVAWFRNVKFSAKAYFVRAEFADSAYFDGSSFAQEASFLGAKFTDSASFARSQFTDTAFFFRTLFRKDSYLWDATFAKKADFTNASFAERTEFNRACFEEDVDFRNASFLGLVYFTDATFTQRASYANTKFLSLAIWIRSKFLGSAEFDRTEFGLSKPNDPSAIFALATFGNPEHVFFIDVNLSRALFTNCDVSQLWFASTVKWGKGKAREAVLFEEVISEEGVRDLGLWGEAAQSLCLWTGEHRNYKAIARTYQQLKKNYDARLDYWTADQFHFGEMEMQRVDVPQPGALQDLRWWCSRNLSLVALLQMGK